MRERSGLEGEGLREREETSGAGGFVVVVALEGRSDSGVVVVGAVLINRVIKSGTRAGVT